MTILRTIIVICWACGFLPIYAQTQQGYVKTLGRPNKPGVALSGVTIRIRGAHNEVLSKKDGTFSFQLTGKKPGDAYQFQRIQKQGYELKESGTIGKIYAYSTVVPVVIVMKSVKESQEERQRITEAIEKKVAENYQSQLAGLEQQKSSGKVKLEDYRKRIQELNNSFENIEGIIDGLAEHYAFTDYDYLTDQEREINHCIENGELEKAEALLKSFFDPIEALKSNNELLKKGQKLMAEAKEMQTRNLKQQERDANYYYHLYTISLARFDNKEACFCIESRAQLDSTNVRWQMDAGDFIASFYSDYKKALSYYHTALRNCLNDADKIECLGSIASISGIMGDYTKATTYNNNAKELASSAFGTEYPKLGSLYITEGVILTSQGDYLAAKDKMEKGIKILEQLGSEWQKELATAYAHLGAVFLYIDNNQKAQIYYEKALEVRKEVYKADAPEIGRSYSHLGLVSLKTGKSQEAMDYFQNALKIFKKRYGEKHHSIANIYFQISQMYLNSSNYIYAIDYGQKALDVYINLFGDNHSDVGMCYLNMGKCWAYRKDYSKAMDYYEKAIKVFVETVGKNHPNVAYALTGLGDMAIELQEYESGLLFYENSLQIYKTVYGPNHQMTKAMQVGVNNTKELIKRMKK